MCKSKLSVFGLAGLIGLTGCSAASDSTDGMPPAWGVGGTVEGPGGGTGAPGAGGASGGFASGGFASGGTAAGGFASGGTAAGGFASGGTAAGGFASGGTAAGGFASGGFASGGFATGGAATGGTAAGGFASGGFATGGAATGGTAAGGFASGGFATGGTATGGTATGGFPSGGFATGGAATGGAATGGAATGGAATGGAATGGSTGTGEVDCDATMPTSGGQQHSATWAQGGSGNLAWQIWSNGGPGSITTYDVPAFTASWNNSGDYLGRMGFEWGNSGKAYTSYGTIKADYSFAKSGSAGQYSYVGIYGWSNNPCIEWYIVEDSFHTMPFNTGTAPSGTAEIDGGTYNLVHRTTSGTGGDRCGGAGSWNQYYSIRLQGKQCGTITVSDHFAAWAAKGWTLGNLLEVKIVVEAAGGQGKVDFPVANVTTTQ